VAAHRRSVEERLRQAELARVEERERAQALRERQRRRWTLALAAAAVALLAVLAAAGWLWQRQRDEADRRAAAAATTAAVGADLDAAAAAAAAGDDARAHEALERAEGRLAGGGSAELRERLRLLRDDLDFAAELEEARMKALGTTNESADLDWAESDAAYTRAFAGRGLDVTGPGAADAAERIGRSPVKDRIVTALDAWSDVRRRSGAAGWEGLLEAAGQMDDSGDEPRRRLREAVLRRDPRRLKELAADPGVADWPATDARLLAGGLWAAKEREAALRVLRAAQGRNPGDFWLNASLGEILGDSSAASGNEGIGFWRAAVAARPSAAVAHYNLGARLDRQGNPAEAEREYRAALLLKADEPAYHNSLGNTLSDQRKPAEAEAEYREALRIQPDFPEAHLNLGGALWVQGRFREALDELRRGHQLGARDPQWPHPSAAWVEKCRRLVEFDALLPAVLNGAADPADAEAALGFASVCRYTKRYAAAARLSAVAFATAALEAVNDPQNGLRYSGAGSAALASCGQGDDAPADDAERARLRGLALAWLRADLTAWETLARRVDAEGVQAVQGALRHWRDDADLAGVRHADALDQLPEGDRAEWRKLWADVDALLPKADPPK
jgi:tetratricopeptide (TPR) repeat protein